MKHPLLKPILGLALVFHAPGVQAGTILAKVQVGDQVLKDTVISVEGIEGHFKPPTKYPRLPDGSSPFPPKYPFIDQKNKTFLPHVLPVVRGTTVTFGNSDPFLHNTHSNSKAKKFNLSQPHRGDTSQVTFDKVGIVDVRCHIHPQMQCWIVVKDNPFFAVTNKKGLAKIENVPAGTYTVKCWSERYGTATQQLTVPATGKAPLIVKFKPKK